MDLQQVPIIPFILSFLLFLVILMKLCKISKFQTSRLSLPPGPSKLPVIGHLHHLRSGLPHHTLRDLAKIHGPLMYLNLGEIPTLVISSSSMAKQMMTTHDLMFVNRPQSLAAEIVSSGYIDVVFAPYGDYWRQARKICVLELLTAKRVKSFWSVREEAIMDLIERISVMTGSPMNLSKEIFALTTDTVARTAFGKTCKDKEACLSGIREINLLFSGFSICDVFPSLKFLQVLSGKKRLLEKAKQKVDIVLERIIKEHQENRVAVNPASVEDFVDVLLRIQEGGELVFPLTTDMIKAITFDMFAAGTDTSSTALEWTFSELLRNPRVMEKAQAEVRQIFKGKKKISQEDVNKLKYLELVIKESLRLHPPFALLLPRECGESCVMEGYEIPKGSKVLVNLWAMGRDPEQWRDPERFVPERFQDQSINYSGTDYKYIPFGSGRRMCPGIQFGIANIELPLALLLYHFDWKIPNGVKPDELDMTESMTVVVKREFQLYVIPMPYNQTEAK
ncbi:hypothetical protein ACHQM5_022556 [Ranunculus cassubicifolius]